MGEIDMKSLLDLYQKVTENTDLKHGLDTPSWGDSWTSATTYEIKEVDSRKLGELFYDSKTDELYVMIENNADGSPDKVVIKDIVDFKKLITLKLLKEKA